MAKTVQGWMGRGEDVSGTAGMLRAASLLLPLPLLLLLGGTVPAAEGGTCRSLVPGSANGCSVPLQLPFFYKDRFTPACNRHDVCYGCGALYRLSRTYCDQAFLRDMLMACSNHKPSPARGRRHATPRQHHHHHHPARPSTPSSTNQVQTGRPSSTLEQEDLQRMRHLMPDTDVAAIIQKLLHKSQGLNSPDRTPPQKDWFSRLQHFPTHPVPASSAKGFEPHPQSTVENIPGYSRSRFIRRMRSERRKREVTWCQTFARDVYFPTVQVFGSGHFSVRGRTQPYCPQHWVTSCLPPTSPLLPPLSG